MRQNADILNSKLLRPCLPDTLERQRLQPLFNQIPRNRITNVIAGAGYGKTTFVCQAQDFLERDTIWYRLDKSDKDLIVFFRYLIAAVQKVYPQFGNATSQKLKNFQNPGWDPQITIAALLKEMEEDILKDLLIVLDDFYLIQESEEIKEALQQIIEFLPQKVHIIIISRIDSGLSLSRLRAMRQLLDITEEDLVFSSEETRQLYSNLFGLSLDHNTPERLHDATGGWVSALILLYHSLRAKGPSEINAILDSLEGSNRVVSSYLEENVYQSLPSDIKTFLLKTSILSRVNSDFCDQILAINNSKEILEYLENNHLFTYSYDRSGRVYYYHHLFQTFLQSQLKVELGKEALRKLHNVIAVHLESTGVEEEAIEHYLEAHSFEKACNLLAQRGMDLAMKGRLKQVQSYIERIPSVHMENEPQLQYLKAKFLELFGKHHESTLFYQLALQGFRKNKQVEGEDRCLKDLGLQHYFSGNFLPAEKRLTELLSRIRDNPVLYIETVGLLILISSFLGNIKKADQYADLVLSLAAGLKGTEAQGALSWIYLNHSCRYICSGDFAKALSLAELTLAQCANAGYGVFLPLTYFQISWAHFFQGSFSDGLAMAEKGFEIVENEGIRDTQYAWLLYAFAINHLGQGNPQAALKYAQRSLNHFQKLGNRWGQGTAFRVLCAIHRQTEDFSGAWRYLDSGLTIIEGLALPLLAGSIKADRAELLMDKEDIEGIPLLLESAASDLSVSKYEMSRVWRLWARYHWLQNRRQDAVNHLTKALEISEANAHESWVIFEMPWIAPLLADALDRSCYQDHISRLNSRIAQSENSTTIDRAQKTKTAKTHHPKVVRPLKVRFLGKFRVFVGDHEIAEEQWKGEKPKMLFKYLVFFGKHRFIPKEVLLELLWPEQDSKRTLKRLNVAFSTLRRILEPNLKRGTTSSYVSRKTDAYRIRLGKGGAVDVDDFTVAVKRSELETQREKVLSHLFEAEAIYTGHFLMEDLYEEWCAVERNRLTQQYLRVLKRIISHLEGTKEYTDMVDRAEKYLEIEACDETIYQALMRCYFQMGNRAMVVRTFERCKSSLSRNLSCSIDHKTQVLYDRLISA